MKKLIIGLLLLTPTAGFCDNGGAEAFATGFANALNRRLGGNPNDSRPAPQAQQVEVYQEPHQLQTEIHAIGNDGSEGPVFRNFNGCQHFISRNSGYSQCLSVTY